MLVANAGANGQTEVSPTVKHILSVVPQFLNTRMKIDI